MVPVYRRFLGRFPDPDALAAAPTADLILAWEDLGYLRRAHHLRAAARAIRDGGWPDTVDGLRRLPGVGPYTAAAVACFAFGRPVAAVDTNLVRVLSRWSGRVLTVAEAREEAFSALVPEAAAAWNQAMMDLGATRCRPRHPLCGACAVTEWCADPSVEITLTRQGEYDGSLRQARAATLKVLAAEGPCRPGRLTAVTGLDPRMIERALEALTAEGMVTTRSGVAALV